jgi:hypothetical protein
MVEDEVIAKQLERLLTPAITNQENYYRKLGLRERILNLPLMMAAVLTLLWRDVAGVREVTRMLARDGFLWCNPTKVSQQAVSQRFLTFPSELFEKVFKDLLPSLRTAWHSRNKRPLPESIQFTLSRFEKIWIVDGSTLEALFRKLQSLEEAHYGQLAGKMSTVIDLMTRLFLISSGGLTSFFSIIIQKPLDKRLIALTCHQWSRCLCHTEVFNYSIIS